MKLYRAKFGFFDQDQSLERGLITHWVHEGVVICLEVEPNLEYWEEITVECIQFGPNMIGVKS